MTLAALVVYWVVLFYMAHRTIPDWVYRARVSDKAIHFVAYLILSFLSWFSLSSDKAVNWRKASAWLVLGVLAGYGVLDEILQGFVGRSCDIQDFYADMAGSIAGLLLFTVLNYWPALLTVTAISIFGITNLARANIAELMPVANTLFHIISYAFFTLVWILNLRSFRRLKSIGLRWFVVSVMVPILLLGIVKGSSQLMGRYWQWRDVLIGLVAIILVIALAGIYIGVTRKAKTKKIPDVTS